MSLSMLSLISLVDIFLAGQIGKEAQAAIGITEQVMFLNMIMLQGLCAGINTTISQAWGSGDLQKTSDLARLGSQIAFIFGAIATLFGFFSADTLTSSFATSAPVQHQAAGYLRICSLANIPWAMIMCKATIFRAVGRAQKGTLIWLITAFVCVALEFLFFYSLPQGHSLASLAVAWNLAAPIGVIYGFFQMKDLGTSAWKNQPGGTRIAHNAKNILRVAIPVMMSEMCFLISNLVLYVLLSKVPDATTAQAAWTIMLRIEESVAFIPLTACSLATATIVAQAIGAGHLDKARDIAHQVAVVASIGMFLVGTIITVLGPYMVPLFSQDRSIQQISTMLLSSSALMFPISALTSIIAASFEGQGDTVRPMLSNLISLYIIRIPLAWFLATSLGAGVTGIWLSKLISIFASAALMLIVCRSRMKPAPYLKTARQVSARQIASHS
ncbi:MAG TPA: MATE family efflux transporter [Planktothrix sp.]